MASHTRRWHLVAVGLVLVALAGCSDPQQPAAPASPTQLQAEAVGDPANTWSVVLSGQLIGGSSSAHMWLEAYHDAFRPAGGSWDRTKPVADGEQVSETYAISPATGTGGCLSLRIEGPMPSGTHASRFDIVVTRNDSGYAAKVTQVFPPSGANGPVWPGPPC